MNENKETPLQKIADIKAFLEQKLHVWLQEIVQKIAEIREHARKQSATSKEKFSSFRMESPSTLSSETSISHKETEISALSNERTEETMNPFVAMIKAKERMQEAVMAHFDTKIASPMKQTAKAWKKKLAILRAGKEGLSLSAAIEEKLLPAPTEELLLPAAAESSETLLSPAAPLEQITPTAENLTPAEAAPETPQETLTPSQPVVPHLQHSRWSTMRQKALYAWEQMEHALHRHGVLPAPTTPSPETSVDNTFAELFGGKAQEQSILNSIEVSKEAERGETKPANLEAEEKEEELSLFELSRAICIGAVLIFVISGAFFFIHLDPENRILGGLFGIENLESKKIALETERDELVKQVNIQKKTLKKMVEHPDVDPRITFLETTISALPKWSAILEAANNAAHNAFAYNNILKYISFSSFGGMMEAPKNYKVTLSGTVNEPTGRTFLYTTRLIEALNEEKGFSGADVRTFSKSENADKEMGGYSTQFSVQLAFTPETAHSAAKKEETTSVTSSGATSSGAATN